MTKPIDLTKPIVMAQFRTVNGHALPAGSPLVVSEEPSKPGEVDAAMATRLVRGGIATYADEHRPTPVETPEQEKVRLAAEALRDGEDTLPDLLIWQADDAETGKKAGAKVTRDDLFAIAARENVSVETDDNKASLVLKITAHRAGLAGIATNSESDEGATTGLGGDIVLAPPADAGSADAGAEG